MRIRALLLSMLLVAPSARAQPISAWGERGLSTMPDARVGADREVDVGARLIAIGGLPTALVGYGRFSYMATDATVMYGLPGHSWPTLSLKHQLQRPTRDNPTGVAIGLGNLGVPAAPGVPGSNLYVTLTRDINTRQNNQDWTLFSAHLGFKTDLSLQSRLMAGLELPLGAHGTVTAEWIGAQGSESGVANFGLTLSPVAGLYVSLHSLGLPNAAFLDRGLALGASYSGRLPAWSGKTASEPKAASWDAAKAAQGASAPVAPAPAQARVASVATASVSAPQASPAPKASSSPKPSPSPTPKPSRVAQPAGGGGTLIGRALDASGKAMASATVTLTPPGGMPERVAVTTPSGYFTFGELPNGSYRLTLSDATGRVVATRSLAISGAAVEVTLKPEATVRLKGQVVDALMGAPIVGALVGIGDTFVETDRDGYFTFEGLPKGPWEIMVTAKGFRPYSGAVRESAPRIAMTSLPGMVSGKVLTADGKPVAGAIAQVGSLRAVTDKQGEYVLRGVPAGLHTLTLTQDGKTLLSRMLSMPPDGKVVVDAQAKEAAPVGRFGVIGGLVRDDAGKALSGVRIIVEGKSATVLTVTDEQGRFSVVELLPGAYRLKLEKGSYQAQEVKAEVRAGSLASVNVTMRKR